VPRKSKFCVRQSATQVSRSLYITGQVFPTKSTDFSSWSSTTKFVVSKRLLQKHAPSLNARLPNLANQKSCTPSHLEQEPNFFGVDDFRVLNLKRGLGPGQLPRAVAIERDRMTSESYTTKQMGDACEYLVAAEMTLRGIPTLKCPDNWPGYDLLAQPPQGGEPLKISVKARTFKRGSGNFVSYDVTDEFDWLAIVLLPGDGQEQRRFFILPKRQADRLARHYSLTSKVADVREWRLDEVGTILRAFEDNFYLSKAGSSATPQE
jgi:hypothetical protein